MRNKQIDIVLNAFKKESVKRSYLEKQYNLHTSVSSTGKIKRKKQIDKMLEKWIKNENKLNIFWKNNFEINLIKALIKLNITFSFPNNYHYDEVSWLMLNNIVPPQDIIFYEIDNKFKLISKLKEKELNKINNAKLTYIERIAVKNALYALTNKINT